MTKLPKRKTSTNIGNSSEALLISTLDMFSNVIPTPGSKDLGIDMRAELFDGEYPTGIHFNIQCKGKEEVDEEKDSVKVQIKVPTINYWLQQREPTFLVVVDREKNCFYWNYPLNDLKTKIDLIQHKESVTITVPKENYFNTSIKYLPKIMFEYMYEYHYSVIEKTVLILSKVNDELLQNSSLNEKKYTEVQRLDKIVNSIIDSVRLIENFDKNIKDIVFKSITNDIEDYYKFIAELDYYPEVKKYIKASTVYDEPFSGVIPRMIINEVKESLFNYTGNRTNENYQKVLEGVKKLSCLNSDLKGFLHEIELDVWG